MRVIGVLDLKGGRAVHAKAGERDRYAPVQQAAGLAIDGDPLALARAYVDQLGLHELYVADLDAIGSGPPNNEAITTIARLEAALMIDRGCQSVDDAQRTLEAGANTVIVGLETLPSFEALSTICTAVGGARIAFSLDLRNGLPLGRAGLDNTPEALAQRAAGAGAETIIVLDLARVGQGNGPDLEMMQRVRASAPDAAILAGGGVRDVDDLNRLSAVGCAGALVATALHNGRLQPARSTSR